MAVSCMRNASGHNYRNSSVTVDLGMGQILRSTERISSLIHNDADRDVMLCLFAVRVSLIKHDQIAKCSFCAELSDVTHCALNACSLL